MKALLATLVALALPSMAAAACPGKYAALARYAGDDPDRLLQEPVIRNGLRDLMGPALARFQTSLGVRSSVALIDCEVVVEGNAPHSGGERNAILSFNLYSGQLTAGMLEQGRVSILVSPTPGAGGPVPYGQVPAPVRDWALVASDAFRSRITPPRNVAVSSPRLPGARGR